jgi:hypothetical protein
MITGQTKSRHSSTSPALNACAARCAPLDLAAVDPGTDPEIEVACDPAHADRTAHRPLGRIE